MLQYRLSTDSHEMIKGIRFEDIYTVYCIDEEIRSLLRQYIEKAEFFYKDLIGNLRTLQGNCKKLLQRIIKVFITMTK